MIRLMKGDCLELMKNIPDKSVDMILCDLPYGTTSCRWDSIIPFDFLWDSYKRIVKDNGAICLFGAEPFSSKLRLSNLEMFKYDWYWNKTSSSGFVNAKLKPMNTMETISVFSKGKTANGNKNNMVYYPQGLKPYGKLSKKGNKQGADGTYWRPSTINAYKQEWTNYPFNYLDFSIRTIKEKLHPTQKPTALLEYLIKTYTLEGETVLDNTMGSGSTGVACVNTGRNFIGIEKDDHYFDVACDRIKHAEKEMSLRLF